MKRCKFCGREGSRMLELPGGFFTRPIPGREEWGCYDRPACHKRAAQIGQWTGVRVLRRRDLDGTRWTILPGTSGNSVYTLTCEYRQHRMTSSHLSIEAAKAHCDDIERSWCSRSMREYTGGAR